MVWIHGGSFRMGCDHAYPEESPVHHCAVDGFWMDEHPVTNAEFARFVELTGYRTVAECSPDPQAYPGVDPACLVAGSLCFQRPPSRAAARGGLQVWWTYQAGACWRHPNGPASTIAGHEREPVVQVAFADAEAYASWAGKSLPTEAEWEFAARGGLDQADYAWGQEFTPGGRWLANTWQGEFPWQNLAADGYEGASPVGAFPANGYGLYDMIGNVWEWTSDRYLPHNPAGPACAGCVPHRSPVAGTDEPLLLATRVLKGGSFLCAPNYCRRYRPAARQGQTSDSAAIHIGFRCVQRQRPGPGS